ncbi:MAG: hypothetical protein ACXADH_13195, partial [Candidatus Kariarchaeaceae archaeon]
VICAESILKSKETHGYAVELVRIMGLNYHFRYFEKFILTLISDEEPLGSILDKIGATFGLDYAKELEEWDGKQKQFTKFHKDLKGIIEYATHAIDPSKELDIVAIYNLPKALQQTALVISTLQMGTVREIARQVGAEPNIVQSYLLILQEEGYVGVIEKGSRSMYFATS